jgi:hypothetical protein
MGLRCVAADAGDDKRRFDNNGRIFFELRNTRKARKNSGDTGETLPTFAYFAYFVVDSSQR